MTQPNDAPGPLGMASGGGRQPGPAGIDPRRKARALMAADAVTLLRDKLPSVLEHISKNQIRQMQKVLDAAVLDEDMQKTSDDFYRRSAVRGGARDPAMVRRAQQALDGFVFVTAIDKRIRLDYKVLLTADALKAVSDNPDEAAYLAKVTKILESQGVWLRFEPKLVRDPSDPSRHIVDDRAWDVWLSLGPNGDTIPTDTGRLTRDILLGTTLFGAGYFMGVDHGPIQAALSKEVRRLQIDIESGLEQHQDLAKLRKDNHIGFTEAADLMGGADFPDQSIWEPPRQFVVRARDFNVGGNVKSSLAFLGFASMLARYAARSIAQYIDDSGVGVERVVAVLKVAKTAGEVAQFVIVSGEAISVVRGGVALVRGGAAVATDAEMEAGIDAYAAQVKAAGSEVPGAKIEAYVKMPEGNKGFESYTGYGRRR